MAYKIVIDKVVLSRGKQIAYVQLIDDTTSAVVDTASLEYTADETVFTAAVKERFKKSIGRVKALETAKTNAQKIADAINILE